MALSINDPEVEALARELAGKTGESMDQVVLESLRDRLRTLVDDSNPRSLVDELNEIALRCAALPTYDTRSADEILGYDENGLPT